MSTAETEQPSPSTSDAEDIPWTSRLRQWIVRLLKITDPREAAWEYLEKFKDRVDMPELVESVRIEDVRQRVDYRIVPLMFCCYLMQYLDKVVLNYAAVMGLPKDLNLQGNEFSNIATFLFAGFIIFGIPNIYFIQRFPAAKWLGFNVFLCGVATASGGGATNYQTLLVSRVFLGMFEATIRPSLMLISSQWYTKSEQAPRFSIWYLGLGLGQILGGAISYGFQHVTYPMAGWRTMFVALGVPTALIGMSTIMWLPDTPMHATWLRDKEKLALLKHVSVNKTGIRNQAFRIEEMADALRDPQIYLLVLSVVLLSISSGVVTTFSATLITDMGRDPKLAALLNMPSGVVSIFFTLVVGYGVSFCPHRWAWILACILPAFIGGALMSFLPSSNGDGILVGIYLVNALVAPLPVFYQLTMANVSGGTKRAFAAAVVSGSFSIGNIIGPQTFQPRDAPEYKPAKIAVLATQAGCAITTVLLAIYYRHKNHGRKKESDGEFRENYNQAFVWMDLSDRENNEFLYSY